MLQTRSGKRTAAAAVKVAVEMVNEGLISKEEAITRVDATQIDQLLHPRIDPNSKAEEIAKGLPLPRAPLPERWSLMLTMPRSRPRTGER